MTDAIAITRVTVDCWTMWKQRFLVVLKLDQLESLRHNSVHVVPVTRMTAPIADKHGAHGFALLTMSQTVTCATYM